MAGLLHRVAALLFCPISTAMLWRLRDSRGRPINAPAPFIHPCRPSEWTCISQNFDKHREQLGRPMEPSSSAELTDKIMCCIRIGKAPPNNGATGTAPELTTLWWKCCAESEIRISRAVDSGDRPALRAYLQSVGNLAQQPSGLVCLCKCSFASTSKVADSRQEWPSNEAFFSTD